MIATEKLENNHITFTFIVGSGWISVIQRKWLILLAPIKDGRERSGSDDDLVYYKYLILRSLCNCNCNMPKFKDQSCINI